mgnify:CR=1 FL=1
MDQKEKIKFMISSLQVALDELEYAENYKELYDRLIDEEKKTVKWNWYELGAHRTPNGTLIRESLKNVARLAPLVAHEVVFADGRIQVYRDK